MQRRTVDHSTFRKWQRDFDRDCKTLTWLDCDTKLEFGNKVVIKLKCTVCTKFKDKIMGRKNFSNKWIVGAESVHTSNVWGHAQTDQHTYAMLLLTKERSLAQGLSASSYAPIAKCLHKLPDGHSAEVRYVTRYRKIRLNAGVINFFFSLPAASLVPEDRLLQVSGRLQVPSPNCSSIFCLSACIIHSWIIDK